MYHFEHLKAFFSWGLKVCEELGGGLNECLLASQNSAFFTGLY